jgi:predicted RNA-binding protein with PIN domain
MPYIIDGHNLIAHFEGIELDDPEDEVKLIRLLRSFCARTRKKATVYFDQGTLGYDDPPTQGGLEVRFITPPRTADQAIQSHIRRLGREASNWTVISSDRAVLDAARQAGAKGLPSQVFAQRLVIRDKDLHPPEKPSSDLSDDEIKAWESIFRDTEERE